MRYNLILIFLFVIFLTLSTTVISEIVSSQEKVKNEENSSMPGPIDLWRQDSSNIRYMKRNFCQTAKYEPSDEGYRVCLNRDGFRDQNFTKEKPVNSKRIVALGDAVTFGVGVDNNQTWPSQLEKKLRMEDEYKNYQVLNFGFPFKSTTEEVIWLNRTGREYNPDIVVLQYMTNDPQNISRVDELETKISKNFSASKSNFSNPREKAIVMERKERVSKPLEKEMAPVNRSLDKLEKISEEDGFDVILMYYTHGAPRGQIPYIRKSARIRGWDFVISGPYPEDFTFEDTFYLNSKGHNATASIIEENIVGKGFFEEN